MEEMTIEDYLTYVPREVAKAEHFLSSNKTTIPKNARGLEGVEVCSWTSFPEIVRKNRDCKASSELKLDPLPHRRTIPCANEAHVEDLLRDHLFNPLECFMEHVGVQGVFRRKPPRAILDPDFAWSSIQEPPSRIVETEKVKQPQEIYEDKILVEVKTFWAFDPVDELVAILNPSPATVQPPTKKLKYSEEMPDKVRRAVSQIYGYMTVNNIRYGVLATYKKFFFFRRGRDTGPNGSRLEIANMIIRDQMRDSHGFTMMEAWISFIKIAEQDHIFASPDDILLDKSSQGPLENPMVLFRGLKLGALWFGKRKIRSQLGTVVNGGLRGQKEKESVMKIVDFSKSSELTMKLESEVFAYREMITLQGTVIPEVRGFLLINNWMMVLVLSHCGNRISDKQFLDHYEIIEKMVKQIHKNGVAHKDLNSANILIGADDKLTIVDFSEAVLRSAVSDIEFTHHCEEDLSDLRDWKSNLEPRVLSFQTSS